MQTWKTKTSPFSIFDIVCSIYNIGCQMPSFDLTSWMTAVENDQTMKSIKILVTAVCTASLLTVSVGAVESGVGKLTCCQEAASKAKDCRHKCCVAAHGEGKSCTKCNPNKEDLKLKKDLKKAPKTTDNRPS
jgi:hypothetical protein